MNTVRQRLKAILAQARGVRMDVVLGRVAVILGLLGGLGAYAHLIPGQSGTLLCTVCLVAAGLCPRVQRAAGLLAAAHDGQTPLLKVVPALIQTLLSAPQIVAQAKTQAEAEAQARSADQARRDQSALVVQVTSAILGKMITGEYSRASLSRDVPAELQAALKNTLAPAGGVPVPAETVPVPVEPVPVPALTALATIRAAEDKGADDSTAITATRGNQ